MLYFHYSPENIQSQQPSEAVFHRDFLNPLKNQTTLGEEVHVYHSYPISKHSTQLEGEIDFLLICKFGVAVIEIKGGLVDYINNEFIQTNRLTKEQKTITPINQARGNKAAIRNILNRSNLTFTPIVAHAIVFPDCTFNEKGIHTNTEDLFSAKNSPLSFIKRIKSLFYSTLKHLERNSDVNYSPELTSQQLEQLREALVPEIKGNEIKFNHLLEAKNQNVIRNIRILRGLLNNRRLMIETPFAGSKSFYIVDNLIKKIDQFKYSKIVYLCWNKLLAQKMRLVFNDRGLTSVKIYDYHNFVQLLTNREIGYNENLQEVIQNEIITKDALPRFDYVVIDEAQEVFHHGLHQLLNNICNQINGVKEGRYTIFYDQAINPKSINAFPSDQYKDFLENSCYYKLDTEYRLIANKGINKFINNCNQGNAEPFEGYSNLHFQQYTTLEDLQEKVEQHIRNEELDLDDTVLLTTSRFNEIKSLTFDELEIEELTSVSDRSETEKKLFYCKALAYRGLVSKHVILITKDLKTDDSSQLYQSMIGASRSVGTLTVFLD